MQVSINEQQSDKSSLSSVELEPLPQNDDPGFGSMQASEQVQMLKTQLMKSSQRSVEQLEAHHKEKEELKQEITKLKCDKLDLLRQNVVRFQKFDAFIASI